MNTLTAPFIPATPPRRRKRRAEPSGFSPPPPGSLWSVESVTIEDGETVAVVTLDGQIDLTALDDPTLARLGRCFAFQFINAPQQGVNAKADGARVLRIPVFAVWDRVHGPWYLEEDAWGTLASLGMFTPVGGRCGPMFPFPASFEVGASTVLAHWPEGVGPTEEDTGDVDYPPVQIRVAGTWYDCDGFEPDGSPGRAWISYSFPTPGFPDALRIAPPAGALMAIPVEGGESALIPPALNPGDVTIVSMHDNGDATVDVTFDAPFTTAGGMSSLKVYAMSADQTYAWWTLLTFPPGAARATYTCTIPEDYTSPVTGWVNDDTFAINSGEQTIRGPARGMTE